jgi:arginine decarboxylase
VTHRTLAELLAESLAAPGGLPWVSAAFVTPYPPGFPLLLPGQVITSTVLRYLQGLHIKEVHGLCHERGLRVFRPDYLLRLQPSPQPPGRGASGPVRPASRCDRSQAAWPAVRAEA